jgi:hypothetical protein
MLATHAVPAVAQGELPEGYRQIGGLNSRLIVWVVAQLELLFAGFVLGVPIFAVIAEVIGWRSSDSKYDHLAKEFTGLLTAAFSTTAALGGLLAFALWGLYPKVMDYMAGIFTPSMWIFGLLFFAETFSLYLYYYSWDRLQNRKALHISIGVLLNLVGTLLMMVANSWATFMMSPSRPGPEGTPLLIDPQTGAFLGTVWQAVRNPLWGPLNIHRFIGNVVLGGFVVAAYAAIRFLSARSRQERAYYDWMGYVGNFIGIAALIPLPFAGYYLGREVYSFSSVMGNTMMGGTFSWPFVLQGMLVGVLFILANFYLWNGMGRIAGAERYLWTVKYINVGLIVALAVWLTPHNLPLAPEEQMALGGQFHPVLKFLGLMAAKNAAINFIIILTFVSFMLYRRANKAGDVPFSHDDARRKAVTLLSALVITLLLLAWYANSLFRLDPIHLFGVKPEEVGPNFVAEKRALFMPPAYLLVAMMIMAVASSLLVMRNRGRQGQALYVGATIVSSVFVLGPYGFTVMTAANPFLRNIAVTQWLIVFSCLLLVTVMDILMYRGAQTVGGMEWGKMPPRSQFALIGLAVTAVMTMGWMGVIRSGLRESWHVYNVVADNSPWAATPSIAYMMRVVGGIVLLFLILVTFVFWLNSLGRRPEDERVPSMGDAVAQPAAAQLGGAGGSAR